MCYRLQELVIRRDPLTLVGGAPTDIRGQWTRTGFGFGVAGLVRVGGGPGKGNCRRRRPQPREEQFLDWKPAADAPVNPIFRKNDGQSRTSTDSGPGH